MPDGRTQWRMANTLKRRFKKDRYFYKYYNQEILKENFDYGSDDEGMGKKKVEGEGGDQKEEDDDDDEYEYEDE